MSNQPPAKRYYPRISSVISENDIPDILGFIKTGIVNLLDNIYFKDLQYDKSPKGDSAFYSLSVVSPKRIDIEIPGTGIFLVLNPDLIDGGISAFPVTIEYQWKILAYLRSFSIGNFSFDPQQIFEVALRVLNVSEEQAIAHFINVYVQPINDSTSSLQQFVNDLNTLNPDWNLPAPTEQTQLASIVTQIYSKSGRYASLVAFSAYLLSNDLQETSAKVKSFFQSFIPQDIDEYIKDIIIPKFRATLLLSAGIEFPRNILVPVDRVTHLPIEGEKVILTFAEALFYADTEKGFGYNMDLVLSTNNPAQIGNTGLIVDINNLKIDLSKTENIAEADADGRPKEFMGVYIEYAEIFLPKKWFKKSNNNTNQTIGISANHLLAGTGGISGNITIGATYNIGSDGKTVVDYFSKYFDIDYENGLKAYSLENKEPISIPDYHNLLTFINGLEYPSQLKFQFPIQLTVKSSGEQKIIKSETEYYNLLKTLVIDPNEFVWFDLGNHENGDDKKPWRLGFKKFDIDFHQSKVVHSSLHAALEVPKFRKAGTPSNDNNPLQIDLIGEWESKENFKLTANFLGNPDAVSWTLFDYVTLTLQTAELGSKDGKFFIGADTKLKFPESGATALFKGKEIDLPAIRIYSNGRFEIAGGIGFIPVNITLPLGPVSMSVTGIHLGSVQKEFKNKIRNYNYIGFDGSISVDPGGIEVRGNGIKYYYTVDNNDDGNGGVGDSFLHISTLEVDLVIPGSVSESQAVAIIKGSLTLPTPGESTEFAGSVSVKLPQANIAGEAALRLNPKQKSFLVTASVEFPAPLIPLGPVGIYGFAGLIGKKYVADKKAVFPNDSDQKTWYDYYMAPEQGIDVHKFIGPPQTNDYSNPFSAGLGVSLASMDGGRIMSLRAMMLLSLPNMFVIDAGLALLTERLGLKDGRTASFYAFIIIGDNSLEFGAGANYQLNNSKGWFIEIKAEIQAGFFFKNQRPWYINFGTKQKPITATLFKDILNIRAESYLMISAAGIEAGARVGFDFDLIIARAWVIVEVGTHISFERPQIGGYIYIEGGLKLNFFIVQVSIAVSIFFSVELIKPFLIFAQLRIQLKLKICWFIKIKINVLLTFKWEKNNKVDDAGIPPLTYIASGDPDYPKNDNSKEYVKGLNMLTNEVFKIDFIDAGTLINYPSPTTDLIKSIIPLDTFIDIKFEKGVIPSSSVDSIIGSNSGWGNGYTDLIPPRDTTNGGLKLRQVKHKYSIESISIKMAVKKDKFSDEWSWEDYHPYEALFDSVENPDITKLKSGHWQRNSDRYDTIRLLATSPFSYMDGGEPGWVIPEQYGITSASLFCTGYNAVWQKSNFLNIPLGTEYTTPTGFEAYMISGLYYNIAGTYSQTIETDENGNNIPIISDNNMVIRNSNNPFGFDQSLEFSNGDNLIITFPEPMAKGNICLTTYSSSVTIELYEKVASSGIKQKYNKFRETTYSKDLLSGIIDFDNLDGNETPLASISKIIIKPETHNKYRIDEINEEIAAIWTGAEARAVETGEEIILTRLESQRLRVLKQELSTLKQEACSDIGCQSMNFKILDDTYLENSPAGMLYFVNDQITLRNNLNEIGYLEPLTVEFDKYSVLIVSLSYYVDDYGMVTNTVRKITDKSDYLCISVSDIARRNSEQGSIEGGTNNLPYREYKYSIIQIDKTPNKDTAIREDDDCGCSDNDNPENPMTVCTTSIQEINWMTMKEFEYKETFPGQEATMESSQQTVDALQKTIQPIWRPNTKYLIHFKLKDEVTFNNVTKSTTFDYFYGFKTMGPLGHFHKQNLDYLINFNEKDKEGNYKKYKDDEKALTSLRSYLDYKRSYPNPDGNLMGTKPLYYGNGQCKIDLFFDRAYLQHMFADWKLYKGANKVSMEMPIIIKDPVSEAIIPYPLPIGWEEEDVPGVRYFWEEDSGAELPLSVQTYINYWNEAAQNPPGMECYFDLGEIESPPSTMRTAILTNLKPEKLYTAQIYSAYGYDPKIGKEIIHEFGFTTSRYKDLEDQVMSHNLNVTDENGNIQMKQAVFDLKMELTPLQVNNLYDLVFKVSNTYNDTLREKFIHEFDRAIEGILKMAPLNPPANTDFVKIIDKTSNELIALLVRNPEPFNDPRIPLGDVADTLSVMVKGAPVAAYKTLWSKDFSQAIIMHQSKKITAVSLSLQFIYKSWDGNAKAYTEKDTVTTLITNLN